MQGEYSNSSACKGDIKNKIIFKLSVSILYVVLNIETGKLSNYFIRGDIPQNEFFYL